MVVLGWCSILSIASVSDRLWTIYGVRTVAALSLGVEVFGKNLRRSPGNVCPFHPLTCSFAQDWTREIRRQPPLLIRRCGRSFCTLDKGLLDDRVFMVTIGQNISRQRKGSKTVYSILFQEVRQPVYTTRRKLSPDWVTPRNPTIVRDHTRAEHGNAASYITTRQDAIFSQPIGPSAHSRWGLLVVSVSKQNNGLSPRQSDCS